jgi:hypothetical protein
MRLQATNSRSFLATALLLAVGLFPVSAAAQQKFWGLTGGATLGDLSDVYGAYSTDSRWGGTAGLVFGVRTYRQTTISLEPAWIQRGGGDLNGDYIEVPLIFGAAMRSNNGQMRYGFYTGISPAFNLSCSEEGSLDACDNLNGVDWSIPIGFRLLRQVKSGAFFGVDVKYGIPLERSFNNVDVAMRTWSFRLMYVKGVGIS